MLLALSATWLDTASKASPVAWKRSFTSEIFAFFLRAFVFASMLVALSATWLDTASKASPVAWKRSFTSEIFAFFLRAFVFASILDASAKEEVAFNLAISSAFSSIFAALSSMPSNK